MVCVLCQTNALKSIYVSPSGNDGNSGSTHSAPFKTLPRLLTALTSISPISEQVDVYLLAGTHYVTSTFSLGGLVIQSQGGINFISTESAVISGGYLVTSAWSSSDGKIYTTTIPQGGLTPRQLFVANYRRVRARSPNIDVYTDNLHATTSPYYKPSVSNNNNNAVFPVVAGLGSQGFVYRANDIRSSYYNLNQVMVVQYFAWTAGRNLIQAIDPVNFQLTFTSPSAYVPGSMGNKGFYIENCLECLDNPGEWYYDTTNQKLYYYVLSGENPNSLQFVLGGIQELFDVVGSSSNILQNVNIKGITFRHADWTCSGACEGQSNAHLPNALLKISYATNIVVQECEFSHFGQHAIYVSTSSSNIVIQKNHIYDAGAGGIRIGEGSPAGVSRITVFNNYIHGGGRVFQAGTGVFILKADNVNVSSNEIADLYYSGVCVGWSWGYDTSTQTFNNTIEYNYIHHIGQGELSDMAGVYTLGYQPGTRISYNLIHDVNAFDYGAWGLYLDEGSTYITMSSNIVHTTKMQPFHIHYGSYNNVTNNMLFSTQTENVRYSRNDLHYAGLWNKNIFILDSNAQTVAVAFLDNTALFGFSDNIYVNTSCGPIETPANWQSRGNDINSVYVNMPYNLDISAQIRYLNTLPAALAKGYVPIPLQRGLVSISGLIPGSTWVATPAKYPFPIRNPTTFVYPSIENNLVGNKDSFEFVAVGAAPQLGSAQTGGGSASLAVSDLAATTPVNFVNLPVPTWQPTEISSQKSLRFQDAADTAASWYPYYQVVPNPIIVDTFVYVAADFNLEDGTSANFELRNWQESQYYTGPFFSLTTSNGFVVVAGRNTGIATKTWFHLEVTCGLGSKSNGTYVLKYWVVGNQPYTTVLNFVSPNFAAAFTWFGIISVANAPVVFYMDNLVYGPTFANGNFATSIPSSSYTTTSSMPITLTAPAGIGFLCGFLVILQDISGAYTPYYFKQSGTHSGNTYTLSSVPLSSVQPGTYSVTVTSIQATHHGYNASNTPIITVVTPTPKPTAAPTSTPSCSPAAAGGNGLRASYYSGTNFSTLIGSRIESNVDYDWGVGAPSISGALADQFSAKWEGQILAPYSGTYIFSVSADDGVRLFVNNVQLVNGWVDQGETSYSGTITLTQGQKYPILLQYYENGGGAVIHLRWSHACLPQAVIAQSQLYSS